MYIIVAVIGIVEGLFLSFLILTSSTLLTCRNQVCGGSQMLNLSIFFILELQITARLLNTYYYNMSKNINIL